MSEALHYKQRVCWIEAEMVRLTEVAGSWSLPKPRRGDTLQRCNQRFLLRDHFDLL